MNLSECLSDAARRFADLPAVTDGSRSLTFGELDAAASDVAAMLAPLSAVGARVAVLSQNRTEYVELMYGIPRAARVAALLNYRLSEAELVRTVSHSGAQVLIAERENEAVARGIAANCESVEAMVWLRPVDDATDTERYVVEVVRQATRATAWESPESAAAWLLYTSGTTGQPKGVLLTDRNLMAGACGIGLSAGFRPGDVYLVPYPLCHIGAGQLITFALAGVQTVLQRQFSPSTFVEAIQRHNVTAFSVVGLWFGTLLDEPLFAEAVKNIRYVQYGGASTPHDTLLRALKAMPNTSFFQNFGMTESAGGYTTLDAESHGAAAHDRPDLLASIGRAKPLVDLRIVDEGMNDVPAGVIGEIVVRSEQNMSGYYREPGLTSEVLIDGWLRTGDLASRDVDGYLWLGGRKRDLIITGGENVYALEVENALQSHPAVSEAVVVGVPDERWGERIVACVLAVRPVSEDELRAHCRQTLAGYKVPKEVRVVDDLPRNSLSKVVKSAVVEMMVAHDSEQKAANS